MVEQLQADRIDGLGSPDGGVWHRQALSRCGSAADLAGPCSFRSSSQGRDQAAVALTTSAGPLSRACRRQILATVQWERRPSPPQ